MRRQFRRTKHRIFTREGWRTRLVFWGGAIIVGLVSALFALMADGADHLFRMMASEYPYAPLVITPLGLVLISIITRRWFPGSEGSGIPQAMVAMQVDNAAYRDRLLSLRVAFGKVLLTSFGMLFGASIGREGPTVHVGAAIMHSLGKYAHFPSHYMERGLILTGGAAGIAAAFNTPLGGLMFAIEEMSRSFDRRTASIVMTGVVLAGMVAILVHQENYNYFGTSVAEPDLQIVWLAVVVCGVLGGVLGGLFSAGLVKGAKAVRPFIQKFPLRVAIACGLSVAIIGIISGGQSYGSGYVEAKEIVSCTGTDACETSTDMWFPLYKILATIASYLSGIPGGIFAPTLAAGAGVGADLAYFFDPELAATIVVLGMVGYFAGVVQTPITAFVIVMEMVDNQQVLMPLMATSLLAAGVSRMINHKPIYAALAEAYLAANPPEAETKSDRK